MNWNKLQAKLENERNSYIAIRDYLFLIEPTSKHIKVEKQIDLLESQAKTALEEIISQVKRYYRQKYYIDIDINLKNPHITRVSVDEIKNIVRLQVGDNVKKESTKAIIDTAHFVGQTYEAELKGNSMVLKGCYRIDFNDEITPLGYIEVIARLCCMVCGVDFKYKSFKKVFANKIVEPQIHYKLPELEEMVFILDYSGQLEIIFYNRHQAKEVWQIIFHGEVLFKNNDW